MHFLLPLAILLYAALILWLATGMLRNAGNPPPIPSSRAHRLQAAQWVRQHHILGPVIEIGSGWGGRWRALAGPEMPYTGVELLYPLYLLSRLLALGNPWVTFRWGDIRRFSLEPYQLVIGYLGRDLNRWVVEQPRTHGQYFISVIFELPQGTPHVTLIESRVHWTGNIYLYLLHAQKPPSPPTAQV